MALFEKLRKGIIHEIESQGGRHAEPALYAEPLGDPGLIGPGSISWEIHGDLASLLIGGPAAILMEVLHPSVMAGVFTQSSYRTDPFRRARNTLGYVLRTTFCSTRAATRVIEQVKGVHARIKGTRADGVEYHALDPELIGWVHTAIPWAVMRAFETYNRPLSRAEKDRYLREQAPIGRMGGADYVPESVSELEDYLLQMRPKLAMTQQFQEFLDFLSGQTDDFPQSARERRERWVGVHASMALLPEWAQRLTGTYQSKALREGLLFPADRLKARLVRWSYPELPCKTMALERARAAPTPNSDLAERDHA
ncbi:MAG: DUF2236 domain-containing protein [Polyangiaceae bacterium]|nr:DUF2236 domain-containing protein [Polyangiaceae bacterium]